MPSEIAAKIDMCENGSEMVQAKYKVKCEKISELTFGKRDQTLATQAVERLEMYQIPDAFGDCKGSEHKSGYFGAFRAFWKCLHLPATEAKLREGNHFDDNLKSSVVIQVAAAAHVELLQLQLLETFGDCEESETE